MRPVNRRSFLTSLGAAGATAALSRRARAASPGSREQRPNILFILADDLGYADLSSYGRRDYQTPVLDSLAADGLRFVQAYSNSPVCSPTRLALATGRYQYRLPAGLPEPINPTTQVGLPPEHPSLAASLRRAGYRTALIGKWHLGALPNFAPLKSGYESFFGISGGGADYVTHTAAGTGMPDLYEDDRLVKKEGYLTDLLSDKAVDYIRASKSGSAPFFLSLHYTAPHWPWQAPGDGPVPAAQALFHLQGGSLDIYARIVRALDNGIGRVMKALRDADLERSTLVVFTSDNGGERFSDIWPFSGQKMDLLEGGIRVPQLARWKGEIPAGTITQQVAITMDWFPTLLSLGKGKIDPQYPSDGMDLSGVLRGGSLTGSRELYWRMRHRGQAAVRSGDWKYLRIGTDEFLFDLKTDVRERANRKQIEPQRFAELRSRWETWNATMLPPMQEASGRYFDGKELAGYH